MHGWQEHRLLYLDQGTRAVLRARNAPLEEYCLCFGSSILYVILMLKSDRYKLPLPRPKRAPAVREDPEPPYYNIYEVRDYRTYILDNVDYYRNTSYSNIRRSYNRTRFARFCTPFAI